MGSVTVLNIRSVGWEAVRHNESIIYIGRGSIYGNPFFIGRDGTRSEVIDKYGDRVAKAFNDQSALSHAIYDLENRVANGEDLELVCFCAPKACHGDVIKSAIEHIASQTEAWEETQHICPDVF